MNSRTRARLAVVLALAALGGSIAGAQPTDAVARARRARVLPLAFSIAPRESGDPVVDDAWLEAQLDAANEIFGPHGIRFRRTERHRIDRTHARLETRRDRHVLGTLLHPRVIDCFFVESLRDVDEPDRYRMGVHWRPRGVGAPDGAHFVIVSSIAGPTVLAHELGHYFGNPHSEVPGNIMSYERGDVPPFFDAIQARRIREHADRFIAAGELVTVR